MLHDNLSNNDSTQKEKEKSNPDGPTAQILK